MKLMMMLCVCCVCFPETETEHDVLDHSVKISVVEVNSHRALHVGPYSRLSRNGGLLGPIQTV